MRSVAQRAEWSSRLPPSEVASQLAACVGGLAPGSTCSGDSLSLRLLERPDAPLAVAAGPRGFLADGSHAEPFESLHAMLSSLSPKYRAWFGGALSSALSSAAQPVVFTYFRGRGHGERVRYALAAADIEYEERFLKDPGALDDVRAEGTLAFGQVPLLQIDGLNLVQSWATVRYLGRRAGLVPADASDAYAADLACEATRDFYDATGLLDYGWGESREPEREIARAACAKYLPQFERLLAAKSQHCGAGANAACFCSGLAPSYADFQLLFVLDYCEEVIPGISADFPRLQRLRAALRALPQMQRFYSGPHRSPRVDERPAYKTEVKAAMGPR